MNHHISSAMADSKLVGHRFHPTDDELLNHFLKPKIAGGGGFRTPFPEVKVCDFEPWDLPGLIGSIADHQVWYFFCRRDYKSRRSRQIKRTTESGSWKPTGKPRQVFGKRKKLIGTKRTLVFYVRQRPKAVRTRWIMHEYECAPNSTLDSPGDFVLCKLKYKADEKISEGEPDIQAQNLSDMTVNSSCDEHESSRIHISCDATDKSIYEIDKQASENQDFDTAMTDSIDDEDKLCYYSGSAIGNPNEMANLSCWTKDFECQNPSQITDLSASSSTCSNCTNTEFNLAELDTLLSSIKELDMKVLAEFLEEGNYDSEFFKVPISPNESSSSCAVEKGTEMGWENELFV